MEEAPPLSGQWLGLIVILSVVRWSVQTAQQLFAPPSPCSVSRLTLGLCYPYEWMKPCCSFLWNNIKCHVGLNVQTWNNSLQLREWFLHATLMHNAAVECWLLLSLLFNDLVLHRACSASDGNMPSVLFRKMFRNLEIFWRSKHTITW